MAHPGEARRAETALTFDDRLAAFEAGRWLGQNERVEIEIDDRVIARLHAQALEALGMSRRLAEAKGPNWAAMVAESGERE
jgi:hypothetical protein